LRRTSIGDKKLLSEKEVKDWDKLYWYVRKEILFYDDSQKMPSGVALMLKGLTSGKSVDNKQDPDEAEYSFEVVLYTFKACKNKILGAIQGKDFKNEASKVAYICKIVESNLNDIYSRLKQVEESKTKTEQIKVDNIVHEGAEYKQRTKNIKNNKLNDLW